MSASGIIKPEQAFEIEGDDDSPLTKITLKSKRLYLSFKENKVPQDFSDRLTRQTINSGSFTRLTGRLCPNDQSGDIEITPPNIADILRVLKILPITQTSQDQGIPNRDDEPPPKPTFLNLDNYHHACRQFDTFPAIRFFPNAPADGSPLLYIETLKDGPMQIVYEKSEADALENALKNSDLLTKTVKTNQVDAPYPFNAGSWESITITDPNISSIKNPEHEKAWLSNIHAILDTLSDDITFTDQHNDELPVLSEPDKKSAQRLFPSLIPRFKGATYTVKTRDSPIATLKIHNDTLEIMARADDNKTIEQQNIQEIKNIITQVLTAPPPSPAYFKSTADDNPLENNLFANGADPIAWQQTIQKIIEELDNKGHLEEYTRAQEILDKLYTSEDIARSRQAPF